MMDRRRFLTGLGMILALALGAPLMADAQPAGNGPRIGFLFAGSPGPAKEIEVFRQGLRELGYIEGQNIVIEYRYAGGRVERLPELAADLVRLKVDVILTPGTPASLAAQKATSTIPIVFTFVADAIHAGLIPNLARPGGNITGLTSISAELGGKRLELLKQVVPRASHVGVLYNPDDKANVLVLKELQEAAPALGMTLQPVDVRGPGDFEGAYATMTREHVHAMFGVAGVLSTELRKPLVELAARSRIPAMWGNRQFVEAGGLMSYSVNRYEQLRRAATYVDKILKGAKPGDLPVEQPTKYELVINLKAAKTLGLTLPQALLIQADQVIE